MRCPLAIVAPDPECLKPIPQIVQFLVHRGRNEEPVRTPIQWLPEAQSQKLQITIPLQRTLGPRESHSKGIRQIPGTTTQTMLPCLSAPFPSICWERRHAGSNAFDRPAFRVSQSVCSPHETNTLQPNGTTPESTNSSRASTRRSGNSWVCAWSASNCLAHRAVSHVVTYGSRVTSEARNHSCCMPAQREDAHPHSTEHGCLQRIFYLESSRSTSAVVSLCPQHSRHSQLIISLNELAV